MVALGRGDHRAALEYARRSYELNIAPDATAWLRDAPAVADALRLLEGQPGRVPATIRREAEAARVRHSGRVRRRPLNRTGEGAGTLAYIRIYATVVVGHASESVRHLVGVDGPIPRVGVGIRLGILEGSRH